VEVLITNYAKVYEKEINKKEKEEND